MTTTITKQEIKKIENTTNNSTFIQCQGKLNNACLSCPKFFTDCPEVYRWKFTDEKHTFHK